MSERLLAEILEVFIVTLRVQTTTADKDGVNMMRFVALNTRL